MMEILYGFAIGLTLINLGMALYALYLLIDGEL
jgi:hypothetical protein